MPRKIKIDKETMAFRFSKLKQMQILPLSAKIKASERRIIEWYDHYAGDVSISFSGGLDSTVLLHMVRSLYPSAPAIFSNTGLEYPENVEFVKTCDNIQIIKPEKSFLEVIKKYGYPVVSKMIAFYVHQLQISKFETVRKLRIGGITRSGQYMRSCQIPLKWQFLEKAPFKISAYCCDWLKKKPLSSFNNPYIGILCAESSQREKTYMQTGCNFFSNGHNRSWPMAFWTREDVLNYIKENNLRYSKIYDMGYERTGCMYCLFGLHMEKRPNRFDKMKNTHPKIFDWCMNGPLKLKEIIKFTYKMEY